MSFTEKEIDVTFDLAEGQFNGGGNRATLTGLRVSASIDVTVGPAQSSAEISIYGLSLDMMNQLTNVGAHYNKSLLNSVSLFAGDANGKTLAFSGQIYDAFVEAQSQPEVFFHVSAMPGFYYKLKPAAPTSIKGSGSVAGMMSSLAKEMGLAFENAGVTARLANPYYWGTAFQQAAALARDAGIEWLIDRDTLIIMDPAKPRDGDVPLISAETGMVGYPSFSQAYVVVTALYNPAVKYGGEIEIQSDLTAACGRFKVQNLVYELESQTPGGRWFMTITARVAGKTVA